jgi:hypothetical protein
MLGFLNYHHLRRFPFTTLDLSSSNSNPDLPPSLFPILPNYPFPLPTPFPSSPPPPLPASLLTGLLLPLPPSWAPPLVTWPHPHDHVPPLFLPVPSPPLPVPLLNSSAASFVLYDAPPSFHGITSPALLCASSRRLVGNSCSLFHQVCADAPLPQLWLTLHSPFRLHFAFLQRSPGQLASVPSHHHVAEIQSPLHLPVLHLGGIEGAIPHSVFGCQARRRTNRLSSQGISKGKPGVAG